MVWERILRPRTKIDTAVNVPAVYRGNKQATAETKHVCHDQVDTFNGDRLT